MSSPSGCGGSLSRKKGATGLPNRCGTWWSLHARTSSTTRRSRFAVKQVGGDRPTTGRSRPELTHGRGATFENSRGELNAQREADRITVNQFAPPAVLVNADLQILQFRGPTSAYLEPPIGKATLDVLKMAREGLMLPLRGLIEKAKKGNKVARQENVQVKQNGGLRTVNVEVIPLKNLRERCFLILFEEPGTRGRSGEGSPPATAIEERTASKAAGDATKEDSRVSELERELSETRDYLQSIQEHRCTETKRKGRCRLSGLRPERRRNRARTSACARRRPAGRERQSFVLSHLPCRARGPPLAGRCSNWAIASG